LRSPVGSRAIEELEIRESRADGAVVVALHGELDLATADGVAARLAEHRDAGEPVLLDLDSLEFIDSSGLRVILQAVEASRRGGWPFHLTAGSEPVRRLLDAAGVADLLPIVRSPR
jgi:anti-anti-sigma factor